MMKPITNLVKQDLTLAFSESDLKPETTVSYELGLKQEVAANTRFELKAFYRDARNYVSAVFLSIWVMEKHTIHL